MFNKRQLQKLGYEFHIYQKTWNGFLVTFLFLGKGYPKLFYFQGRGPKVFYFQER